MELKELITTIRRWAWMLAIGLLVGFLAGNIASLVTKPVYETSTKLMISREVQEVNPDFAGLNSQQLVETYIQLLKTRPLLDTTTERTGVAIDLEQVSVQQIPDTQIIEITIDDHNPENAAMIANTMVQVLIERNKDMQTGQNDASVSRLTTQVEQVSAQIDALQKQYDQAYEIDYQDQLSKVDNQINEIQTELSALQVEIAVLNPANRALLAEKQIRVEQLQSMFAMYEQIRANLLVLGRPLQSSNIEAAPRLQQLQSTLNLYQNLYLTLTENLEKARLALLQQTPNVVQIEEAIIPDRPVRPIPILYTLLGGMVGGMLAIGVAFLIGISQSNQKIPEEVMQPVPQKKMKKSYT